MAPGSMTHYWSVWEQTNPAFFHLIAADVHGAALAGTPIAVLCGKQLAHAPEFGPWDAQHQGDRPNWPTCPACLRRVARPGEA